MKLHLTAAVIALAGSYALAQVQTPETALQEWPERSRLVARTMIEKYGEPSRFGDDALVWFNNGPWQRTVVHRRGLSRGLGLRDRSVLEQSISYDVPAAKLAELEKFDKRLEFDAASGELSSRSDSESSNYIVLNLADAIISDKRSVDDARDFLRRTERLAKSGRSSPYLDGFVFGHRSPAPGERSGEESPEAPPQDAAPVEPPAETLESTPSPAEIE